MSNRKPKLCIVTPTHSKACMGGAQYQIDCLLDTLIPLDRYEIYYLARRVVPDFQPEDYRMIRIGQHDRMPRLGFLVDIVPLYRALRKIGPDVIYQRVACGYTGIAGHYARRNGPRLIWHISADADVTPGSLPGHSNAVRHFLEKRSIEYGIHNARHIVAQTTHQAELLKKNFGREVDAVVPNFQPEPHEVLDKTGPLTVLWVANLKQLKHPEVFVRLAHAMGDMTQAHFVMIGAPPETPAEREWNNELMRSVQTTPNLQYLGPRSQGEVNALMATSHLFVNTSLEEGFPNTFIQAWMRGVPVMSLHVNPDGVLDREGVGVHAESEYRLAQAVRDLLEDAAQRDAFAQRAQDYAMRTHSVRNAQLLRQLIDTGRVDSTENVIDYEVNTLSSAVKPMSGGN